ncbi:hypothetical protein CLV56_1062 [Mumia flava]|uniref:DUF305 domain-containing protein n=1 Tax=Mumia flava TaxID=1348852 RepID=A0A0B2BL35_9ACTN|nr:hypothetical protein [Mumia flava]PJJ56848.1 hypothetical protein CLV56_1062 [Mumia flava]
MPRSVRTRRLIVAAAATLALAGCGANHPGDATVVGSAQFAMSDLDRLADAGCLFLGTQAAAQGAQAPDPGSVRSLVAAQEMQLQAARSLAAEDGIELEPSAYAIDPAQVTQIDDTFGSDADDILELLEKDYENVALRSAIGEQELGVDTTAENQQQVQQAGAEAVAAELERLDPAVDPRLGVSDSAEIVGGTGSLSVAQVAADPAETGEPCQGVEPTE